MKAYPATSKADHLIDAIQNVSRKNVFVHLFWYIFLTNILFVSCNIPSSVSAFYFTVVEYRYIPNKKETKYSTNLE